ncbi:hypothetical protein KNP414_00984 [Paenibacillus mucilaginosus KNP414]|uniref:Uncharacterized protein n=1 Tax=Paenibacillus mucilaginosus (strain KNP414) TaxID=1036673 RepID=F8FAC1_PAEMK|nr:hypothetical protein KNP414_00984 [Paenibacillus mucilaginosus KNP414]
MMGDSCAYLPLWNRMWAVRMTAPMELCYHGMRNLNNE